MESNICRCNCGTRITLDQQLLEERQAWKQKYLCLQKQATNDIGRLKENIYAECSVLMQQEFTNKQTETTQAINTKNLQIKSLTSRVINLEARIKILEKENQILKNKEKELQADIADKDKRIQGIRARDNKSERDWQVRLEEEVTQVRKRVSLQYDQKVGELQSENQHLKHKVKEFQKKYQVIIPEVQKLKNTLNSRNQQLELLQGKLQKTKKDSEYQIQRIKQEAEEIQKLHAKSKSTATKLSEKVQALTQELQGCRKVKKEVRVEPVYIQRPVQVQKVVEKIVEVEKIVNKYIQPTSFRDEELQMENTKLKEQMNNLLKQIHLFQDKHRFAVNQYQECIKQHQENVIKYKKQRETLAKTIQEQQKEIDMIHLYLEKKKTQSRNQEPQKIIVHVNKDGSYQKTVQRIGSNSVGNSGSSIPVNSRQNRRK